jgi:hypothetical protein
VYHNSPDISPEATIVVRAQQIVNRWNRSKGGATFAAALSHELDPPGDPFIGFDHHRLAVRQVAEAIHSGKGNGFSDRVTLLQIAREVIREP